MLSNNRFPIDQILIGFNEEIMYGEDQMDVHFPARFPTVILSLRDTDALVSLADKIRTSGGGKPLYPMEGYPWEACDQNGWYNFYIGINDSPAPPVDTSISAYVDSPDCEDNGSYYAIPIPEAGMNALFQSLDAQCRKHLGKSCADLLTEARKEMEAHA